MSKIIENNFESREALMVELGSEIITALSASIENRGKASMLLSGGTTPGPLYKNLCVQDIAWDKVWFSATDERWVDPDHPDSNERLIRDTLLQNKAANAHYVSLKSDHPTPHAGQRDTEENFRKMPLPFDIVLLGMGEDGHVASLFPNIADSQDALGEEITTLCHAIKREEGDVDRMTVTLNGLLNSKQVFLLFFGTKKLDVFNSAKNVKTDELPVSYLLHQDNVPISLYWAE